MSDVTPSEKMELNSSADHTVSISFMASTHFAAAAQRHDPPPFLATIFASTSGASVEGWPFLSSAQPSGSGFPILLYISSLPRVTTVVEQSKKKRIGIRRHSHRYGIGTQHCFSAESRHHDRLGVCARHAQKAFIPQPSSHSIRRFRNDWTL